MRVGKYRIIFSKDDWNKILIIHRIGTRWDIYKKL
jgi:mRNA-degrading endonuclease RelE of RelBE toxin-antitoxin system